MCMYIRKISSYASLDCKSRNGDKIEHGKGVTGLDTRFSHKKLYIQAKEPILACPMNQMTVCSDTLSTLCYLKF